MMSTLYREKSLHFIVSASYLILLAFLTQAMMS